MPTAITINSINFETLTEKEVKASMGSEQGRNEIARAITSMMEAKNRMEREKKAIVEMVMPCESSISSSRAKQYTLVHENLVRLTYRSAPAVCNIVTNLEQGEEEKTKRSFFDRCKSILQTLWNGLKAIGNFLFQGLMSITNCSTMDGISRKGKDIAKLPNLRMISKYAMPWDFIKNYLPNKDSVLAKRRWFVISKYLSRRNATLDTLKHLLEWSPDYDPENQFEDPSYILLIN
ncbi:hypothetical protein DFA_04186 [Cavenderia fasciculata]|uniref:Uncharacterized protein n=1 Tax=Cavenderia fasciculata TaxID=261658 RepID=F4Q1I9_CACFS|nr:uncharacterized protein DFA_04186 [Cavenderia fasciculata]EGG18690.1 hypothetical protein DFA_04186 [Cavenderia fasciculata]|eukprot:XP_004366594.1 hypothetical protein DFA_04186 [Cavenderia fasciculata]